MADRDMIPLEAVRINGGTQSRAELNAATIAEYTEAVRAAIELPPVIAFFDGAVFWLADGFHRFHAHRAAGATEINAEIRTGTQRDAILHSVGANASHGLRRTNEDKRRAITTLLDDPEWSSWSDSAVAKACAVSDKTVSACRAAYLRKSEDANHLTVPSDTAADVQSSICVPNTDTAPALRTVERNGKVYEQNTANIGAVRQTRPVPPPQSPGPAMPEPSPLGDQPTPPRSPLANDTPAPTIDEVAALREQLFETSEHLKSTLADNEMMGRVFDADDKVKAAMAEAIRQKAIAENAERTLVAKTGEFIERARAVTHWMGRALKAEKTLAKLEAPQ